MRDGVTCLCKPCMPSLAYTSLSLYVEDSAGFSSAIYPATFCKMLLYLFVYFFLYCRIVTEEAVMLVQ